MTLPAGARLGSYEILSPLGAGGMGEVYRAKDSRLGRDVAIKVLPEDVARDPDRLARFEREARALAALNHPGIVTIFSVEESGETRFLAMELVEGESLDTVVASGGLPLSRFFEIATPLAEALSAAHERGIVHRDLKPGNVMVTREGRVKVLDFGLARVESPDSHANLTSTPTESRANLTAEGKVFGTVAYMSPEQARGGKIDARSDVFSLGIVLYQMLTGERPFQGESPVDLITSILRDRPPSVTDLRPDVPPQLSKVLRRCLEKDSRDRYQTSRDVYNELRELWSEIGSGAFSRATSAPPRRERPAPSSGSRPGRSDIPWIAVLPLETSTADTELEAFADGLAEDITTGLSRFRYLSVVARASTVRLKGRSGDVRAVAADLGARYLLEGRVRKGGSSIRVSARVIEADTGTQLWAGTYDRDPQVSGIFDAQDDVAARIVATVADSYGVLVRSMTAAIQEKTDPQLSPSEWLFQYFAYRQQLTPSAHASLKSRLLQAVERDAGQSDLWACLALVHTDEHAFGFQADRATLDRALAAARRSAELDRTNPFALLSLAQAHFFRQELAAFRPAAEQAMALNPLNTDALGILGLMIVHTAEFQRGAAIVRRAMELNPSHAGWFHFGPIWEHFERGEYERALEHAMQVNMPGLFWQPLVIAAICGQLGRRAEGAAAVRDLLALDPDFGKHGRRDIEVWHFASGLLERILDGVRNSGLEIAEGRDSTAPASAPPASGETRTDEGFWVAVLPFQRGGADAGLAALGEGMTDEIVTGLSRFSYLRVISRTSTRRYSGGADVRSVGRELGARYVLDGSLRQAGSAVRISVQLIDAVSGANLWAETYNRSYQPDAIFEVQDDVVRRIVSTVADTYGVLPHSMSEALRGKHPDELSPYEAVIRGLAQLIRVSADEHASVRAGLERAVEQAPGNADCWALLSNMYREEYAHGFNLRPDPVGRALAAARRAVEIAPSNHLAHHALATALFLRREFPAFRSAAERAIALNPMDGFTMAFLGSLIAYSGDWERGCAMAKQARDLNPNHPSWYWFTDCFNAYRQGDDRAALDIARKIQMPGFWRANLALAATYGQLGEREPAARALQQLLMLRPNFAAEARAELQKWWDPDLVERVMDGLRKAGLEAGELRGSAAEPGPARASAPTSGAARADEGFWVAALPFHHSGEDASLAALAEGMTDEIVTGLSRFSYLRVISRGSTRQETSEAPGLHSGGRPPRARYVIEGNLRRVGSKLRATVQLVDTATSAHLWAETYERPFSPEAVFELQDDLVPRIVSTVADQYGALVHSMSESLRGRSAGEYSAHEAVLRAFGYWERVTREEHAEVREILEAAVSRAPDHSECLAELSMIYGHEYVFGYNVKPDSLGRARAAAQRSIASAPSNHFAHFALATILFFQKDFLAFRTAAERALALNRMDSSTAALLGTMIAYAGDWEHGLSVVERAKQLNPHHPGWYHYLALTDAYRRRDYRGALASALKVNMPGYYWPHVLLAAVYGQLGEPQRAGAALRDLQALIPNFGATAREEFGKWHDGELSEHLLDGLRKAGLDVPDPGQPSPAEKPVAAVSIAVLPFSDMSAGKDQDYLCEGMAEEIMNALVRIPGIRVASRTSTFRARQQQKDLAEVARALNVGHVLEGSVRTSGNRLRVTAQLTDVASGYQLWSERFDREAADVFAVQDEIAAGVVDAVKSRLAPGVLAVPARPQARNLEAYRSYLKGRHLRGKENFGGALSAFEEAVRLDPSHAPSWTGLAEITVLGAHMGMIPPRAACEAARRALATAARLQGESAEGLHVEAFATFLERRWAAMEAAWRRALELEPRHVLALGSFGLSLCSRQRLDEGLALFERAREADPLASFPYTLTAWGLLVCGKPQEALRFAEDALGFEKEDVSALSASSLANVTLGRFEEGIAAAEHAVAVSHRGAFFLGELGWALATAGRRDEARTILEELRARPAASPTAVSEAWLLGALGQIDDAFDVLARAEEEYQGLLSYTGLPGFDPLRSDPRFAALLRRLELSPA